MLNSEKNAFHDAIKASAIEHGLFRFESASSKQFDITKGFQPDGLKVQFEGSDLWFVVFKVRHDPGDKEPLFACKATHYDYVAEEYVTEGWLQLSTRYEFNDHSQAIYVGPLVRAREAVANWITVNIPKFVQEKSVPDLWQIAATGGAITSLVGDEDTPFTETERGQLQSAVEKLQKFVEEKFESNQQQRRLIAQRFDALIGALQNQGRMTWFTLALGTLVSVGSTLYLNNEQGRELLTFARHVFENAVNFLR